MDSPMLEIIDWPSGQKQVTFPEASGLVYHPLRETLFVVGDEGFIGEVALDGTLLRQEAVQAIDLEGITVDPQSGLLYGAVEGDDLILELDPDTLEILRQINIERPFQGEILLAKGGSGIEAITFVADEDVESGGYFLLANQNKKTGKGIPDPSVLVRVDLPPQQNDMFETTAVITQAFYPNIPDMSGLHFDASDGHLFVISDRANGLFKVTVEGDILYEDFLPGKKQEGFTVDRDGVFYIAQDSGSIMKAVDSRK